VLALDARRREASLFVPEAGQLPGFAAIMRAPYAYVAPGEETARRLGVDRVVPLSALAPFLDRRLAEDSTLVLRGPFGRDTAARAAAALAGQDRDALWEQALRARWPRARLGPAPNANRLRDVKEAGEVEALRRVARSSAAALLAGLGGLAPGRRQRAVEVAVVAACVGAGADGPSFWPWVMTGPNAAVEAALNGLADFRGLDRVMRAGELARVDVGCVGEHYAGDVGRTAPVSGRFTAEQREAWDLFVAAYRAGLAAIRPGRTAHDVFVAWQGEVARRRPALVGAFARQTADQALDSAGTRWWQLHGVGVAAAEGVVDTLRAGQVVAFEPILTVGGVGLYLEDMILVTPAGAEVLTSGLPYTAAEIERVMRAARTARSRPRPTSGE
jgi:Xaa-Pro aminopeptidase